MSSARVLTFGWSATDPDGFRNLPQATRYLLLPVDRPDGSCFTQLSFETEQPIRADDPRWSEWIPYDPDDESTHRVTFPRAELGKFPAGLLISLGCGLVGRVD